MLFVKVFTLSFVALEKRSHQSTCKHLAWREIMYVTRLSHFTSFHFQIYKYPSLAPTTHSSMTEKQTFPLSGASSTPLSCSRALEIYQKPLYQMLVTYKFLTYSADYGGYVTCLIWANLWKLETLLSPPVTFIFQLMLLLWPPHKITTKNFHSSKGLCPLCYGPVLAQLLAQAMLVYQGKEILFL